MSCGRTLHAARVFDRVAISPRRPLERPSIPLQRPVDFAWKRAETARSSGAWPRRGAGCKTRAACSRRAIARRSATFLNSFRGVALSCYTGCVARLPCCSEQDPASGSFIRASSSRRRRRSLVMNETDMSCFSAIAGCDDFPASQSAATRSQRPIESASMPSSPELLPYRPVTWEALWRVRIRTRAGALRLSVRPPLRKASSGRPGSRSGRPNGPAPSA